MDSDPAGSSVHGILQARILEWVAMPSSRGSSWLKDQTHVSYISCIGRWVFLPLAREPQSHLNQICKGGWETDFSFPKTEKLYSEKTCQNNDFETSLTSVHTGNTCFFATTHTHGLPQWLSGKETTCNAGDPGLIPGWVRSPGEGNGNPLQYSCLQNPVDGEVW